MTRQHATWLLMALLVLLAGCDRTSATSPPTAADGGVIAARLPRVVHSGGPILRNPEITTVTFAGDSPAVVARLERFGDTIATTGWWHDVVDSYCLRAGDCIGDGRAGRHVRLAHPLPTLLSDTDIERLLAEEAQRGALTQLGRDALVLVYLPPTVTLRDASHSRYCARGPRAYHRTLRAARVSFAYAVIPRCGDDDELTVTASHEILEASTNPDPQRPGFRLDPGSNNGGFTAAGTEPADPCGLVSEGRSVVEGGFAVQRAWSNRAARAGHDPCVPASAQAPYLALVPQTPTVRLAAPGATATIRLDAASDRDVAAAWAVSAIDLTGRQESERYVEVQLDRQAVKAGESAVLSLRLLKLHPQQRAVVGVVSTLGPHSHTWPIAISMR